MRDFFMGTGFFLGVSCIIGGGLLIHLGLGTMIIGIFLVLIAFVLH